MNEDIWLAPSITVEWQSRPVLYTGDGQPLRRTAGFHQKVTAMNKTHAPKQAQVTGGRKGGVKSRPPKT